MFRRQAELESRVKRPAEAEKYKTEVKNINLNWLELYKTIDIRRVDNVTNPLIQHKKQSIGKIQSTNW